MNQKKEKKRKKWKFRVQAREDSELIWVNYIFGKIPQNVNGQNKPNNTWQIYLVTTNDTCHS